MIDQTGEKNKFGHQNSFEIIIFENSSRVAVEGCVLICRGVVHVFLLPI